jgi:hypothetical protein
MSYYSTNKIETAEAMKTLHKIFPDAQADENNFVLFSTSGVHGSYCTIEDCETLDDVDTVTFLIIKPRIVQTNYGNCRPETPEDFEFLKKLRETSRAIVRDF